MQARSTLLSRLAAPHRRAAAVPSSRCGCFRGFCLVLSASDEAAIFNFGAYACASAGATPDLIYQAHGPPSLSQALSQATSPAVLDNAHHARTFTLDPPSSLSSDPPPVLLHALSPPSPVAKVPSIRASPAGRRGPAFHPPALSRDLHSNPRPRDPRPATAFPRLDPRCALHRDARRRPHRTARPAPLPPLGRGYYHPLSVKESSLPRHAHRTPRLHA
jgi:hypothetical protein